jgi:hypothetical protein
MSLGPEGAYVPFASGSEDEAILKHHLYDDKKSMNGRRQYEHVIERGE